MLANDDKKKWEMKGNVTWLMKWGIDKGDIGSKRGKVRDMVHSKHREREEGEKL